MDFDNFEFKPLTKGLGFDKNVEKTVEKKAESTAPQSPAKKNATFTAAETSTASVKPSLKIETPASSLFEKPLDWNNKLPKTSRSITEMINALPPSMDFFDDEVLPSKKEALRKEQGRKEPKVYQPLGRIDYNPALPDLIEKINEHDVPTTKEKVDVSLDNTLEKAFPKVGFRRPFFHQAVEPQPQYTEITTSFTSAVLDALVITGMTALLLVGLILLTGIDLIAVVLHSKASAGVWFELGSIYLGVYFLYYMCARGFWGSTLGDWAFDIHLGTAEQRLKWYYPYQVVLRMAGIAATGFILMPLLSLLTGKDTAATYSKLRLYIKNY